MKIDEVIVPAGKYLLGDPCYHIKDEHWDILLDSCEYFQNSVGEIFGHKVLAFSTMYGDGCYSDNHTNSFCVDAGLIGLIPWEYIEEFSVEVDEELAVVVTFEDDTKCYSEEGNLVFGTIEIRTGNFEDDSEIDEFDSGCDPEDYEGEE